MGKVYVERGLTVIDPWAQAIVYGTKRIENRTFRPRSLVGKYIAIHCGKSKKMMADPEVVNHLSQIGYGIEPVSHHPGCIIGVARVDGWVEYDSDGKFIARHCSVPLDALKWYQGPPAIGWVLSDVKSLKKPLPFRGAQGILKVEMTLETDG